MNKKIIYCAICIMDNKKYIGQTVETLLSRKKDHENAARDGENSHLYDAMREHGFNRFCWGVIDKADNDEQADYKEKYWIKHLHTTDEEYGYNIAPGEYQTKTIRPQTNHAYKIYCAVCIIDHNKKYIGQTKRTLSDRREEHERNADNHIGNSRLYDAMREHGFNRFCWGVIDTADNDEQANYKERCWISILRTTDKNYGYNIEIGGHRPVKRGDDLV